MNIFHSHKNKKAGISVIEVVISIAIFSILATVGYEVYASTNKLSQRADNTAKANWLAEEGIEAVRSIRDTNYALLTVGTKGLATSSTGWVFSGTSDVTNGFFRTIVVTNVSTDTQAIQSNVSWLEHGSTSTVSLNTRLTNWDMVMTMASSTTINTSGANLSSASASKLLTGINIINSGAAGTSTISSIQVSWTTSTRRLKNINSPNSVTVFGPATITSGTVNTLTTQISLVGALTRSIEFLFDGAMTSNTITLKFNFTDGSNQTVVIVSPPLGA